MGDDIAAGVLRPISPPYPQILVVCRPAADREGEVNKVEPPKGDYIWTAA